MAEALARITRVTDRAMIAIRTDLTAYGDKISDAAGLPLPDPTRQTGDDARTLVWMSPDEVLLVLPADDLARTLAALDRALGDVHALVTDVSDMRAVFDIDGPRADQVLAKLSPTDMATMPHDAARRTRAAQVPVGFWRTRTGFRLVGFRSVADYLALILDTAALPGTHLDPR